MTVFSQLIVWHGIILMGCAVTWNDRVWQEAGITLVRGDSEAITEVDGGKMLVCKDGQSYGAYEEVSNAK